jgi:hypothetical protein
VAAGSEISADADVLADSYIEWSQLAEEKMQDLRSSGLRVEKIDVHIEELILWCNERGLEVMRKRARGMLRKG